jgi:riboflavin synthase
MFTGIVEEIGIVSSFDGKNLTITASKVLEGTKNGDSISVDGVCLTVVTFTSRSFSVSLGPETLKLTTLKNLKVGSRVNLERSVTVQTRMGGHQVEGHVDQTGTIVYRKPVSDSLHLKIKIPKELSKFLVKKGFIAVDGISLTINEVNNDTFDLMLIPHTLKNVTLGDKPIGSLVNIEIDIESKRTYAFVHKMTSESKTNSLTTTSVSDTNKTVAKDLSGLGLRICILTTEWNTDILDSMKDAAIKTLKELNVSEIVSYVVPGSFEFPLAIQLLHKEHKYDAYIPLGCTIKGDTAHFEYVTDNASRGILTVGRDLGVPVIFGLLTCYNKQQARERAGLVFDSNGKPSHNLGIDYAKAAVTMCTLAKKKPIIHSKL